MSMGFPILKSVWKIFVSNLYSMPGVYGRGGACWYWPVWFLFWCLLDWTFPVVLIFVRLIPSLEYMYYLPAIIRRSTQWTAQWETRIWWWNDENRRWFWRWCQWHLGQDNSCNGEKVCWWTRMRITTTASSGSFFLSGTSIGSTAREARAETGSAARDLTWFLGSENHLRFFRNWNIYSWKWKTIEYIWFFWELRSGFECRWFF